MLKDEVKVVYSAFPGYEFTPPMMHKIIISCDYKCTKDGVRMAMLSLFKSEYLDRKESPDNRSVVYFKRV